MASSGGTKGLALKVGNAAATNYNLSPEDAENAAEKPVFFYIYFLSLLLSFT